MKQKTEFELNDIVYVAFNGVVEKATVIRTRKSQPKLKTSEPILILIDGGTRIAFSEKRAKTALSFTPFTIELKGFTSERPQPVIEKDTLVWVRDEEETGWRKRHYSHTENEYHRCFVEGKNSGETNVTYPWDELSLTNPLIQDDSK